VKTVSISWVKHSGTCSVSGLDNLDLVYECSSQKRLLSIREGGVHIKAERNGTGIRSANKVGSSSDVRRKDKKRHRL
jgi:hypothetical protein